MLLSRRPQTIYSLFQSGLRRSVFLWVSLMILLPPYNLLEGRCYRGDYAIRFDSPLGRLLLSIQIPVASYIFTYPFCPFSFLLHFPSFCLDFCWWFSPYWFSNAFLLLGKRVVVLHLLMEVPPPPFCISFNCLSDCALLFRLAGRPPSEAGVGRCVFRFIPFLPDVNNTPFILLQVQCSFRLVESRQTFVYIFKRMLWMADGSFLSMSPPLVWGGVFEPPSLRAVQQPDIRHPSRLMTYWNFTFASGQETPRTPPTPPSDNSLCQNEAMRRRCLCFPRLLTRSLWKH